MSTTIRLRSAAFGLALFSCWWSQPALAADWTVEDIQDPLTAERVSAAVTRNEDGFSIAIFRNGDSRVRWVLRLPTDTFSQLPTVGRIAAFRVDRNEAANVEIEERPLLTLEQPHASDTWVRSILWHGQDPVPTGGYLRRILDGEEITVRFFVQGEQPVDAVFSLDSAPAAIGDALGITVQGDPEAMQIAAERESVLRNLTQICMGASDQEACSRTLVSCSIGNIQEESLSTLKACMAGSGYPLP